MAKTYIALAALAAATVATPASAAIIISTGGNTAQGQTVQFDVQQTGNTITGTTNQTSTQVTFTRVGAGGALASDAAGQAVVVNNGTSNPSYLTGTVAVDLFGNTAASYLEFNLPGIPGNPPPAEASSVLIEALATDGVTALTSGTFNLDGNGQNYFNITGTQGSTFGGFRVTLNPADTGVGALQNVRVQTSVAAAVPEPGTWALMLLGFGGVGVSLRRRRSRTLPQFA